MNQSNSNNDEPQLLADQSQPNSCVIGGMVYEPPDEHAHRIVFALKSPVSALALKLRGQGIDEKKTDNFRVFYYGPGRDELVTVLGQATMNTPVIVTAIGAVCAEYGYAKNEGVNLYAERVIVLEQPPNTKLAKKKKK